VGADYLKINDRDPNSEIIQEYFRNRWNFELRYPKLPCISVYGKNKRKCDFYPIEVCEIVEGIFFIGLLNYLTIFVVLLLLLLIYYFFLLLF